ncbi:Virulence-associated protein E [Xylanibacter ruminicola]|uniref:Virulence-associated protein E n=1 Tax=Xylanibacter ruminicola TaxID=839 RepID=A0A1M7E7Q2_XYLRU|nr:BT4734/BF3469 family protein [Xylanibacter ruminicola]SHL87795.1 Virulence-associated protein E [Xylanibacter ruminicola]
MKITLLKKEGRKEVINRVELVEMASAIKNGMIKNTVRQTREVYHLMNPHRLGDGQISTQLEGGIKLPRICFVADYQNRKGDWRMLAYNGLVVLEVNDLQTYERAVEIRELAKKMPETLMCFLGGSGRSVKIVCRGELFEGGLPTGEQNIRQFHQNLYNTARMAYQNQFGFDIQFLEPRLDRTVYMSADPEMGYRADARPFYADTKDHTLPQSVTISKDEDHLMPGRTVTRTYHLNWTFIVETVMGHYFDLPDENKEAELLMQIAARCLDEGIPQAHAKGLTMLHPVLNRDKMLVEKIFQTIYSVAEQEGYREKHKPHPLKSVPEDTIQAMKTEIFLNSNFDMRKNLLTGVAEYREKFSDDQRFKPLTEEVRNDMTLRATELGLKAWDRNVNRFIDSTRIEQFDPINTWLDQLPKWDGHDYIAELAARVPTKQPHWPKYLRYWLMGMVGQWRESDKQLTGNALTPLLIGRQGCGKTRFCKIILPPELRDYYNDKLNFKNEFDLNIALTSFALINIDEFDKTTSSQQIVLKYLLSSSDVKFRPPYGKTIKLYRRYTSFIGTTNQMKPLVDPTGSRRFVCVDVEGNIDFSDTLNHEQLFAQALHLFNQGERFWLNDDEISTLIEENEPFQKLNDLVEMIGETFRRPKETEQAKWWSLGDISALLASRYANFDPETSFRKIGSALNDVQFNFTSKRTTKHMEYWLIEK